MTAAALLLVGLALLVWPGRARVLSDASGTTGAAARTPAGGDERRRQRTLAVTAALGLGAAAVAVAGPRIGLPLAVLGGPVVLPAAAWLSGRPRPVVPDRRLAPALDLVAAVLRSGRPVSDALAAAAPAARADVAAALARTARLLAFGARADQAWSTALAQPGAESARRLLEPVAAVAVRSQDSGIRLADAFERHAADVRAECATAALARANRAGVHAMGPLAACFLPSFVCLGIVPVVVGVASTALHGTP